MGEDEKSTEPYEVEKEITAAQAQKTLVEAAQKRAQECQVEIRASLLKHDCYQYPVHIYDPARPFWDIITKARIRT